MVVVLLAGIARLPRLALAAGPARHRLALQADDPWAALERHPTSPDHDRLHGDFLARCPHSDQRRAVVAVLYVRASSVEFLLDDVSVDRNHVPREREHVRQGVLPAPDRAALLDAFQPCGVGHPARDFSFDIPFRKIRPARCKLSHDRFGSAAAPHFCCRWRS
jgi:hypothetical protein